MYSLIRKVLTLHNQITFSMQDHWAHWKQPLQTANSFITGLKVHNTLRPNQLVPFIPIEGKLVKFYYCGPTVYSFSHLGHARTYIYLDILKKILRDYFKYDLYTVMNITDIDDKIIKGSNEEKLDYLQFTKKWETDFFDGMKSLNVELPDVITRVSEYVPEIISFTEKIVQNGYAYESNGSVYFDVEKYTKDGYHYCKLEPFSVQNIEKLKEGEGFTQENQAGDKKSQQDFALWKNSKPGEPKWDSPWGQGRPGWHIECSAMAHQMLGGNIDIHAGGEDLKFPHHDNSIAQTEAALKSEQWINYFLHTGHLNIKNKKMSKSEKNFFTISEVLEKYTARQVRLTFALHKYDAIQNYSEDAMKEAVNKDQGFNEFYLNINSCIRTSSLHDDQRWGVQELSLNTTLLQAKKQVYESLCNNFDFPEALKSTEEVIKQTNIYMKNVKPQKPILINILQFVNSIMSLLGLDYSKKQESSNEDAIAPLLDTFTKFRDCIRVAAKDKNMNAIFQACDQVRDDDLVFQGIKLEDKAIGEPSVWKYSNKDDLLKERDLKLKMKQDLEEDKIKKAEIKRQKEALMRIPPQEWFKGQLDQYSAFDVNGIPTLDQEGKELSAKQQKVVKQAWETQKKIYDKFMLAQQQQLQQEEKKE